MSSPSVSVIIPLYNNERFIGEAVHSILNQTLPVKEIIVVDDGSTDGSISAVPSSPLVKVISRPHTGIGPSLNVGIKNATGSALAFLDSDDRWLPTKLERQIEALESDAPCDMIFCQAQIFYDNSPYSGEQSILNGVSTSGFMIKRHTFDQVGLFSEGEDAHKFMTWYALALEKKLRSHIVPEVLFERRIHDSNTGIRGHAGQRASYFTTIKAMLDRRRAQENK